MGYLVIFRLFSISAENEFSFSFDFSFSFQKCHLRFGPKMLCSLLISTVTKFCDIGTDDVHFRFSASKNHTKIIKRHERNQFFCPGLRKLRLLCKLHKIWSVDSQDNH